MAVQEAESNVRRAEEHAREAERLLKSRYIWSYVQADVHATLALYYTTRESRGALPATGGT